MSRDSTNPSVYDRIKKGAALLQLDRDQEALEAFEQAIVLDPNSAQAWFSKGITLRLLDRYQEALEVLERAIVLDPNFALAWVEKGNTLTNLGCHQEALEAFEQAIVLDPHSALTWVNKGGTLAYLGRHQEALEAFEQAIVLDPNSALAWLSKGATLRILGRYQESLKACEQVIILDPSSIPAWFHKSVNLAHLGRYQESLEACERAIVLDPNSAVDWLNKGANLANLGRHQEALGAYERAIVLDPNSAHAWVNKGIALGILDGHQEALGAYEQAIVLDPNSAFAWYQESILLAKHPALVASAGHSASQCLARAIYLTQTRHPPRLDRQPLCSDQEGFIESALRVPEDQDIRGRVLSLLRASISLPLLARKILLDSPLLAETISFGGFFEETMKRCETPLAILDWLEFGSDLANLDRLVWQGITCYYHGDPCQAFRHFDAVDSECESNLTAQYYLVLALQGYLEPCKGELNNALRQADIASSSSASGASVEQTYYAGHIHLLAGDWENAAECFSQNKDHLPSLYMGWLILQRQGDKRADSILGRILEEECLLVRQGKCGYLLPQSTPEIEPGQPGWPDAMRFYVHFREIEPAILEVWKQQNLERFPDYHKLFPSVRSRILGERDAYVDQAKVWKLATDAMGVLEDIQRKKKEEQLQSLRQEVHDWLNHLELPATFSGGPPCAEALGHEILRNDLSKKSYPFEKIVIYYFCRDDLGIEDAVFLLFYNRLKMRNDGVDQVPLVRSLKASEFGSAIATFLGFLAQPFVWHTAVEGASAAIGMISALIDYVISREEEIRKNQPFPPFKAFKNDFYEYEVSFGNRATVEEAGDAPAHYLS